MNDHLSTTSAGPNAEAIGRFTAISSALFELDQEVERLHKTAEKQANELYGERPESEIADSAVYHCGFIGETLYLIEQITQKVRCAQVCMNRIE